MSRFIVLNTIGAAVLLALEAAGLLGYVSGPGLFGVVGIGAFVLLGLALIACRNFADARFVAQHMTYFALVGTVLGLIVTFTSLDTSAGIEAVLVQIGRGFGLSLLSTLAGLLGYGWLNLNLRLYGEHVS